MIWSAWNNGRHHTSGAGYGIKVPVRDRDSSFKRGWRTITIEIVSNSGAHNIDVNNNKDSFWTDQCHELIHKDIGIWLRGEGVAPWPKGEPPRLFAEAIGEGKFRVRLVSK